MSNDIQREYERLSGSPFPSSSAYGEKSNFLRNTFLVLSLLVGLVGGILYHGVVFVRPGEAVVCGNWVSPEETNDARLLKEVGYHICWETKTRYRMSVKGTFERDF